MAISAAVVHRVEHVAERRGVAGHLEADVEALVMPSSFIDVVERLAARR